MLFSMKDKPIKKEIKESKGKSPPSDLITKGHNYNQKIIELIRRRRLQILVSSYVYMELDDTYISDEEWDYRAKDLYELQHKYPEESKVVVYYDLFKDWTGDSASGLVYDDWIASTATKLLDDKQRRM